MTSLPDHLLKTMASNFHKQIDVASIQLDRAIVLLIDDGDYFSSATLAGAAEEIFGKLATSLGKISALDAIKQKYDKMLSPQEKEAIGGKKGVEKVGGDFNVDRNWLKHHVPTEPERYFDAEAVAHDLIERAIDSRALVRFDHSAQILRFNSYASGRYTRQGVRKEICPHCNQAEGLPLVWGDPNEDMQKASQRGEVILGGCLVDDVSINRECLNCGYQWTVPES